MKTTLKSLTLLTALASANAFAFNVPGPLVDPAWVNQHKGDIKILEIGKKAHLPGAEPVNYKKVRVKTTVEGVKAKGMLPSKAQWEKMVQGWGINKGDAIVIAYPGKSPKDATKATRLYWQFKYYGDNNVSIMNGGMVAYKKAKLPLDKKGHGDLGKKGNWVATAEDKSIYASTADTEAASQGKNGYQLIDSRNTSLYLGTWHKGSVKGAGHIAGAKLYPFDLATSAKPAKFLSADAYKKAAAAVNVDLTKPSIAYCNTGHLASGNWFIMHELLGNKKAKLYDGSAHLWTQHGKPLVKFKMENM